MNTTWAHTHTYIQVHCHFISDSRWLSGSGFPCLGWGVFSGENGLFFRLSSSKCHKYQDLRRKLWVTNIAKGNGIPAADLCGLNNVAPTSSKVPKILPSPSSFWRQHFQPHCSISNPSCSALFRDFFVKDSHVINSDLKKLLLKKIFFFGKIKT